jgi:signal transduction histidine kinase
MLIMMAVILLLDRLGTDLQNTTKPGLVVGSAVVGSVAIMFVFALAKQTLLRQNSTHSRLFRLLFTLGVASGSAATFGRLYDQAVGLPVGPTAVQLFQRTGWGFTVLVLLTVGTNSINGHRALLTQLAVRATNLDKARTEITSLIQTAVASEQDRIVTEIRRRLAGLSGQDAPTTLASLRATADDVVRPASHTLATDQSRYDPTDIIDDLPEPSRATLVYDLLSDRPLRPTFVSLMLFVWGAAYTGSESGLRAGLLVGFTFGITAFICWQTYSRVIDRFASQWPLGRRAASVLFAAIAATASFLTVARFITQTSTLVLPIGEDVFQLAIQGVTIMIIPVAQMLGRGAKRRGEMVVAEMQQLTESLHREVAGANAALWAQRRHLARVLHGPIQSALHAATLRLALSLKENLPLETALTHAKEAIERALQALDLTQDAALPHTVNLAEGITRITGLWDGVAHIELETAGQVSDDLAADPVLTEALLQILTEACSNAVRHGHATHIAVQIGKDGADIRMVVTDNGRPTKPGEAGQGTALLDEIALDWDRTHDPSGTCLTVTLASALPFATLPLLLPTAPAATHP